MLLVFVFSGPEGAAAEAGSPLQRRTWTDSTGKYTVEAEFAGMEAGKVSLRKADGAVAVVPVKRLGEADREYAAVA